MSRKLSTTTITRSRLLRVNLAGKTSKALALALMFWCAGAGCMMVSYTQGAMREMESLEATEMSSMMHMSDSMDAHACCKAKRKNAKRSQAVSQTTRSEFKEFTVPSPVTAAMSCCPLTSGSIVFASRSNGNDDASVSSNTDSSAFKLLSSNQKPVAPPLRLPNRAHSYLLDCAFLI